MIRAGAKGEKETANHIDFGRIARIFARKRVDNAPSQAPLDDDETSMLLWRIHNHILCDARELGGER